MEPIRPLRSIYPVEQFIEWQRSGQLQLTPIFQRRHVWSKKAKSFLIDTVLRGMPMPIVMLRRRADAGTSSAILEVVDGQQRLRTLIAYVNKKLLPDFEPDRDDFRILRAHDHERAGKAYNELDSTSRETILTYEISTHILPASTGDDVVLRIFSRLNSTGYKLNDQEIRNSAFFGEFKSLCYELAFSCLAYWRNWGIFDDEAIARMLEVEMTSDLLVCMMQGIQGKSQPKLRKVYAAFDDALPGEGQLRTRFNKTMEAIDDNLGTMLAESRLSRTALFYSLFTAIYDHIYGLGSDHRQSRRPRELPALIAKKFQRVNQAILAGNLPERVSDAMEKATADVGRRRVRHQFFLERLGLEPAD